MNCLVGGLGRSCPLPLKSGPGSPRSDSEVTCRGKLALFVRASGDYVGGGGGGGGGGEAGEVLPRDSAGQLARRTGRGVCWRCLRRSTKLYVVTP